MLIFAGDVVVVSPEEVRAVKCFYFTPQSLSHTYASWCLGSTVASVAVCVCFVREGKGVSLSLR